MNKRLVLSHLAEAAEELNRTIREIQDKADYAPEEFRAAMSHLYHHVNSAWNGRNSGDQEEMSPHSFEKWRRFPPSSELLL